MKIADSQMPPDKQGTPGFLFWNFLVSAKQISAKQIASRTLFVLVNFFQNEPINHWSASTERNFTWVLLENSV